MRDIQHQPDLLNSTDYLKELEDATLEYQAAFYTPEKALSLYNMLLNKLDWQQETIKVYGKSHLTPRLSCWMGDKGTAYGYSKMVMHPEPWRKEVLSIKYDIETLSGHSFNSVLINYYRDGKDSNGWHSDNEPELGTNPVIASLSLGASRDFHLRHKSNKHLRHKITLTNGSLLMMSGTTQQFWQHHIPKRTHAKGRINLTFRKVYKHN